MKPIIVIVLLSLVFSLEMLGSGWVSDKGMILRGVNSTDGIWNLALIVELKNHFPPEHPGFAEIPLRGYHFLFHGLVAVVSEVTFIPVTFLYFQVFPLIISFLWGLGVFKTVVLLTKNNSSAYISTFISFFGGSFAFVLHLLGQSQLSIDSGLGIAQPYGSSLSNPAYASSIVLVIWSLYSCIQYLNSGKYKWLLLLIVLSGLAVGFKAYAGMILMGALLSAGIVRLIVDKKFDIFIGFIFAAAIAYGVFYPFNGDYGFLVFAPFLHIIKMIEGPLSFTTWDELYHIQRSIGNNFGTAKLFALVFIIFTLGNLGSRILGVVGFITSMQKKSITLLLYVLALISISFLIPFFFLQPTAGAFNIYQMHWYFLFLVSVFVGPGAIYIFNKISQKNIQYIVAALFIIATLPSALHTLENNIRIPSHAVSSDTIELLHFMSQYGVYDDTVLEIPSLPDYKSEHIENWFWKESNVIIAALGSKRVYVSHEVVPYAYEDRIDRLPVYTLFGEMQSACIDPLNNCEDAVDIFARDLNQRNIRMIYIHQPVVFPESAQFRLIKANESAAIYEVLSM